MALRVEVGGGKYTIIQEEGGGMRFLRYGEEWPAADEQFAHVGMILAMAQELEVRRRGLSDLLHALEIVKSAHNEALKWSQRTIFSKEQILIINAAIEKAKGK